MDSDILKLNKQKNFKGKKKTKKKNTQTKSKRKFQTTDTIMLLSRLVMQFLLIFVLHFRIYLILF